MDDDGVFCAKLGQHFGHEHGQSPIINTQQLSFDAGRIGERAENVEYGARADFLARPDSVLRGAVQIRRKQKGNPDFVETSTHLRRGEIDMDAKRFNTSALPHWLDNERCHVWQPSLRRRRHEGRTVEMLNVPLHRRRCHISMGLGCRVETGAALCASLAQTATSYARLSCAWLKSRDLRRRVAVPLMISFMACKPAGGQDRCGSSLGEWHVGLICRGRS
jgi:hypothetical protein